MRSYVRKKSSKRIKTAKKRRTLLKNRLRVKEKDFAKICCRCELRIRDNEHALGGGYDGVVCLNHRSCTGCWFDTVARGARKLEAAKTKNIALVNKPFKPTKNLIRSADSHFSWSMTDEEINPGPKGADLNLHQFKGSIPLCPGCKKGLPPFQINPTSTTQYTVDDDGVVNIEDSDSE